jgi:glycosyltransferase involved in cell wall biosynthesis
MAVIAMIVTNACAPDPRVERAAKWLVEEGHEVIVHAFDRSQSSPKLSEGNGFTIIRHQLGEIPYGGMAKTAFGLRKFHKKVISELITSPPDLIYCHDADTLKVGMSMKKNHSLPFVFDMHDLAHTWILMPAPKSIIRKTFSRIMLKQMLRRAKLAEQIITSSGADDDHDHPGFKQWLSARGLDSTVVENRPDAAIPLPLLEEEDWRVAHIGRLRDLKSIKLLIDAIMLIPMGERPSISIAGEGTKTQQIKSLLQNFQDSGDINFNIRGRFNQNEIREILAESNVMFAMYNPARGNIKQGAIPVKMFDAAVHGIPSIVNSNCLMGDICTKESLGLAVEWDDAEALKNALISLNQERVKLERTSTNEKDKLVAVFNDLF